MGPDLHLQPGAPSLRGGEVFFNASFISADGLNAPASERGEIWGITICDRGDYRDNPLGPPGNHLVFILLLLAASHSVGVIKQFKPL